MKLRELNGLIRKADDKILIGMIAPDGRAIKFRVPKSLVLAGLKEAFDGEAATYETQLLVDENGKLRPEGEVAPAIPTDDDEDLLVDDNITGVGVSDDDDDVEDLLA